MTPIQRAILVEARRARHNWREHWHRERRLRKSHGSSWVEAPCAKCDRTTRRVILSALLCREAFT